MAENLRLKSRLAAVMLENDSHGVPSSPTKNKISPQTFRPSWTVEGTDISAESKKDKGCMKLASVEKPMDKAGFCVGQEVSSNQQAKNPLISKRRLFSLDVSTAADVRRHFNTAASSSATLQGKRKKRRLCIIPHNSNLKIFWDWFVLILVIYTAVQIPYQAAFPIENQSARRSAFHAYKSPTAIIGYVVDAFFLLDIFINFLTTYPETETEEIVTDHRKIAIHYLKTWFTVDFIAVIPFDWFVDAIKPDSESTATLFGLLKSARLLRLFRVARKLDRYSEYGVAVLFLLMSMFTLIAHWLACVWHVIGYKQPFTTSGWLQVQAKDLGIPIVNKTLNTERSQRYVASLYFVLSSLTSVGFGNVAANTKFEQIFTIIVMLLGALMYATVFGNMVAIVQRIYSRASRFHNEMGAIKEFLRFYKIPEDLRRSIQTYVRQEWTFSEGVDVQKVLGQFPLSLQMDICYELYQGVFSEVKALQGATVSCMRAMGRQFRTLHLQVGHYVLRQGDQVKQLFIIGRGAVEVIRDGELITLLGKNTMIGYDFKAKPSYPKANADLRASTSLEIHYIDKDNFAEILKAYPKFSVYFNEVFRPEYFICDETEEGLARPSRTKPKLHLGAIAKTALRFSFLKFRARSNADLEDKNDDEENDEDTNPELDVVMPNGHANLTDRNENVESINLFTTKNINDNIDVNTERPEAAQERESNESFMSQRLVGLEERIGNIEHEMLRFRDVFNSQISTVLSLLTDLKSDLDKREYVTNINACSDDISTRTVESGTGMATTKL